MSVTQKAERYIPCPICGEPLNTWIDNEFSTEEVVYGYDDCQCCGWSGPWSDPITQAEPK